jgi:hypothetical protein
VSDATSESGVAQMVQYFPDGELCAYRESPDTTPLISVSGRGADLEKRVWKG